jgi:hypothetical protein
MTITAKELSQKSPLIKAGMEFYVKGHDESYQVKIVASSVTTVRGTSCWGEYEEIRVFYSEIVPKARRVFVTKQRPDGSSYHDMTWVYDTNEFNSSSYNMRIDSFIEFKYNKQIEASHA